MSANEISLPVQIQDPNPVPAEHEALFTLSVTFPDDDYAPIIIRQDPSEGEVGFFEQLFFLIADPPDQPNAGLDPSTLSVYVDGRLWITAGAVNTTFARSSLSLSDNSRRMRLALYPVDALADGNHAVRILISDVSGNTLDYTFNFTQLFTAIFDDVDQNVELNDSFISRPVWDFKLIANDCPHVLPKELHFVDGDMETIRLGRPIASKNSVQLFLNGEKINSNDRLRGWRIVEDELSVQPFIKSKIVFNRSLQSPTDLVEVTYTTFQVTCPRCHSLGVLDDYLLDNFFDPVRVILSEKLVQEMLKIVLTDLESNFRYDWYGTGLVASLGQKISNRRQRASRIRIEILDALENLRRIQQRIKDVYDLRDIEILDRVIRVDVNPFPTDPTGFDVEVEAVTLSGTPIYVRREFFTQTVNLIDA